MGKKIATIISTLLHPMLMPTIGLLVIFNTNSHLTYIPFEYRRLITIVVFLSTCVLPLSIIPVFIQLGVIKSVYMVNRKERILPLFMTAVFFILGYYFLKRLMLPSFISLFFLGTLLSVLLSMGISFFWKISIHMVGIGGLLAALFVLTVKYGVNVNMWLVFVMSVAGVLGSMRLYLGQHTKYQVYAGFLLGFAAIFFVVMM